MDSDLAWVNGKSGRQSWRFPALYNIGSHLPFYHFTYLLNSCRCEALSCLIFFTTNHSWFLCVCTQAYRWRRPSGTSSWLVSCRPTSGKTWTIYCGVQIRTAPGSRRVLLHCSQPPSSDEQNVVQRIGASEAIWEWGHIWWARGLAPSMVQGQCVWSGELKAFRFWAHNRSGRISCIWPFLA